MAAKRSIHMELPYGKKTISLLFPESINYAVLDSIGKNEKDSLKTDSNIVEGREIIKKALSEPIAGSSLKGRIDFYSFFNAGDTVAVIVSDYTRATGSEIYIPLIVSELKKLGIKERDITLVVALGLHRPATEKEMIGLVTEGVYRKIRVVNHNPHSELKKIGNIRLNGYVVSASRVIITGSVTFHPMAGFSGGYKSILPGVASKEDILRNHKLYFKGLKPNPVIEPGRVKDNPVLQDIIECSKALTDVFCLNVVLDNGKKIVHAASGDVLAAWESCYSFLKEEYSIPLKEKYSIVVASAGGYPADFSFYQSMKVLTNSVRACRENGRIIILSQCSSGWEIKNEYLKLFQLDLSELSESLLDDFNMEKLAIFMAMQVIRKFRVYFFSTLPPAEISGIGMIPVNSREELENLILKVSKKLSYNRKIAFIKRASYLLPEQGLSE